MMAESQKYRDVLEELIATGRYDTRDDFTVVMQPFFANTYPPKKVRHVIHYTCTMQLYKCFRVLVGLLRTFVPRVLLLHCFGVGIYLDSQIIYSALSVFYF